MDIEPLYESWNITILRLQNTNEYFLDFPFYIVTR